MAEKNRSNTTVIVSFRATIDEAAAIDAAAAGDAEQRATWVRQTVLEAIRNGTPNTTTDATQVEALSGMKHERRIPASLWLCAAFTGAAIGAFIGAIVAVSIQHLV